MNTNATGFDSFVARHGITSIADRSFSNPLTGDTTDLGIHHSITLEIPRRGDEGGRNYWHTYITTGAEFENSEPSTADILALLAGNAASVHELSSFNEWAHEYGYDDSPELTAIEREEFYALVKQAGELRHWLGDDRFIELLSIDND